MVSFKAKQTAATLLASTTFSNAALYSQVISTQYGDIQGYPAFNSSPQADLTNWKDITVWKGIPFAASTAGNNRFRAPQPAAAWNSTLDAKDFGAVCPAATTNSNYTIDEDCLNLNIWSAANSTDAGLPVVMWSYPAGSTGRDPLFDGGGMADKGVVFVNYNYRTGSFGWLATPELSAENVAAIGHNSSGNWGMLDQFAALKWIKANVQNFGGDPDQITVMGQSAGSAATYHILNSPLTKGDIKGAIIESGVRDPHDPLSSSLAENYATLESSYSTAASFLSTLNVTTMAQARALPYADLVTSLFTSGSTGYAFTATLDHYALPSTYYDSLVNGAANDVPVITGNTKDESGANYNTNLTYSEYIADLNTTFNGTWSTKFFDQYPVNSSDSNSTIGMAYNAQWTDRSIVGTWLWSQLWATNSSQPVYNYIWNHAPPGQDRGAYHESEINYVLNNLYDTDSPWTDEDYAIAATMNSYWVNFIKTQDPNGNAANGSALVDWPAADDSKTVQTLGNSFEQSPLAKEAQISLFEDWFSGLKVY